ncbi:MAG: DUF4440 domain-containing protein [Gemmatimonadota bacterium]|nr:DUF4440 domain-containing protein [Gemmatimonadota bacterium]
MLPTIFQSEDRMNRAAQALLIVVTAGACVSQDGAGRASADVAAIAAVRQAYVDATVAGDVPTLIGLMTSDVVLLPPAERAVTGLETARARFLWIYDAVTVLSDTATIEETLVIGDWAYIRGSYARRIQDDMVDSIIEDAGKFSSMLRRQDDGSWKIARDMWNTSRPPAVQ